MKALITLALFQAALIAYTLGCAIADAEMSKPVLLALGAGCLLALWAVMRKEK